MQTVGVDVGGTFTDISVVDEDGKLSILKVLSTPNDFSEAICSGIEQEIQTGNLAQNQVSSVVHAALRSAKKYGNVIPNCYQLVFHMPAVCYAMQILAPFVVHLEAPHWHAALTLAFRFRHNNDATNVSNEWQSFAETAEITQHQRAIQCCVASCVH